MVTSVNQRLLFLSFACYVVICVIPIFDLLIDGRKNKEAVVEMSYFSSGFGCCWFIAALLSSIFMLCRIKYHLKK